MHGDWTFSFYTDVYICVFLCVVKIFFLDNMHADAFFCTAYMPLCVSVDMICIVCMQVCLSACLGNDSTVDV